MVKRTIRMGFFLAILLIGMALPVWASGNSELIGREIIIGNWWAGYDVNTYQPRNDIEEQELKWRMNIQKDNGFIIREQKIADWDTMLEIVTTSIMSGRPVADVFVLEPAWAMKLYRQRLLYPISDSKAANFNTSTPIIGKQIAYNQGVQDLFTFNRKLYAIAIGYGNSQRSAGVYFNKRLFREAGLDENLPYDLQKDGTWTWDRFLQICKQLTRDTNNDGIIDTYALPMDPSPEILDVVAFSNGAEYVGKDASGNYVNASNTPELMEALQFCRRLKNEGIMMYKPEGSNGDWYLTAFQDGKVAMIMESEWRINDLQDMADDWGYVLFPKGPKANDYRFPNDEYVLVVPATFKPTEVDAILTAINLWHMPVTEDWKTPLYSSYRDRRAVDETLVMIHNPKYAAFRNHILIPGLNRGDIAHEMWWFGGYPQRLVDSVSESWNALINEANATN